MIAIEQSLDLWMPQVLGKYINEDWNPTNKGFGAQCWDLAAHWSKTLGLPVINTGGPGGRWPGWAGNMVDAFPQTPEIAAAYDLIDPSQPMEAADIVVWDDSFWYYPKTHVAVGVREVGSMLLCVSQNSTASQDGNPYPEWTTGPATLQHLPKAGCIGYIRPRLGGLESQGNITTPIEEDELSTEQYEDLRAIAVETQLRATVARDNSILAVRIATENQSRIGKLAAAVTAVPGRVWATNISRVGKKIPALQELANIFTKVAGVETGVAQILENTSAEDFAASIPDDIAQQVVDALAARLAGGATNG